MDSVIYRQIYELERDHWWFQGRRAIINSLLGQYMSGRVADALDIGCGTGFNADLLKVFASTVYGLDSSDRALAFAHSLNADVVLLKGKFPFYEDPRKYHLISLFDVLEHIRDDGEALKKVEDLLHPGGVAVFTVPALPLLWSEHDVLAHHKRRYTKQTLTDVISSHTNLEIERMSYFNFFLFLPILLFRKIKRRMRSSDHRDSSDIFEVPRFLNALLFKTFLMESYLLRHINFPVGVSLICVARKRDASLASSHEK